LEREREVEMDGAGDEMVIRGQAKRIKSQSGEFLIVFRDLLSLERDTVDQGCIQPGVKK
jgi:hypothetical protein